VPAPQFMGSLAEIARAEENIEAIKTQIVK